MISVASALSRVLHALLSPRVALWLLVAVCLLLAVWVLPFSLLGQSEDTVAAIATTWLPLRAAAWSLAAVTLACAVDRFLRDLRRCRRRGLPSGQAAEFEEGWLLPGARLTDLADGLRGRRFDVSAEEQALVAVRGRYRPLAGSLFHAGLTVLLVAVVAATLTTETTGLELIEGQSAGDFYRNTPGRPVPEGLRASVADVRLDRIEPHFYGSYFLFQRLDASVTRSGRKHDFALARPLWLDPVTYLSIQDFNYAPRVVVRDASGTAIDDQVTSLKLFPPGSEDAIALPSAKAKAVMSVFPEHGVVGGKDVSLSYNLRSPRIRLTLVEDVQGVTEQRVLARALTTVGAPLRLPDGSSVTVAEIRRVGTFRLVRAPMMPLVLLSAALTLGGLAGRLARPRVDVAAREVPAGVLLRARVDSMRRDEGGWLLRDLLGESLVSKEAA